MKQIKILSDYTPAETPNILTVTYDDQGDIHFSIYESKNKSREERGVRIATSGSRHVGEASAKFHKAIWNMITAYEEFLVSEDCHPDLRNRNR